MHWMIDFSVKMKDGTILETDPGKDGILLRPVIEAPDIFAALEYCRTTVFHPILNDPDVEECVIWDIGIVEPDVFAEEEEVSGEDTDNK